jgi:hypothetical protein
VLGVIRGHDRNARVLVLALALLGAFALVLALLSALVMAATAPNAAASPMPLERLPDLDQELPSELVIRRAGTSQSPTYALGFRSAVRNIGAGPLVIQGRRMFPASDLLMQADQLIQIDGGLSRVAAGVGELHYVRSSDHQHWHYVGFDRYELRRAGEQDVLVQDRKTGFCLGDRYRAVRRLLPASPQDKVYRGRCGLGQTGLLTIREGISVGYGDAYKALLEYQDLPISGLGDGRYVLVHRVNADGRLRELSYDNNAASLLLDLRWRGRAPSIRVLASCPSGDRCDGLPPRVATRSSRRGE